MTYMTPDDGAPQYPPPQPAWVDPQQYGAPAPVYAAPQATGYPPYGNVPLGAAPPAPWSGPSSYAFISYSHALAGPYVESLNQFLNAHGIPVWFDRDIVSGDRWSFMIRDRIDNSGALIIVMTPDAEDSRWVNRELDRAEGLGKAIFPLLLAGNVFFRLSDVQYYDVRGGYLPDDRLIARLRAAVA